MFSFFPVNIMSSTYTERRITLFHGVRIRIPHVLDLGGNLQCNESWEIFPLELHRLPADSIQSPTRDEFINRFQDGLLSDNHKHSPYQRIHVEVLLFVFWLEFQFVSHVRVDFLEVWNGSTRYAAIARPLPVVHVVDVGIFCGKFPATFLKTRILVRSCSSEFP